MSRKVIEKFKTKWQGFSPVEKYLIIFLLVLIVASAFRFTSIWEGVLEAFRRWDIVKYYGK